mmetsp:Transcript_39873/g.118735  ORF Transcript_39873/g.118735 Transcript_39873/m.118735 type:complete len:230 (-) Transcript_39873:304-993(-)
MESDSDNVSAPAFGSLTRSHGDSDDATYVDVEVVLRHARDVKDVETLGKQDPYCVLRIGANEQRSKVHVDGGRNPVWNQDFLFTHVPRTEQLSIKLLDSNVVTADEMIGEAEIQLADLIVDEDFQQAASDLQVVRVVPVKRHGRHHGDLHISISMGPSQEESDEQVADTTGVPASVIIPVAALVAIVLVYTSSWKSILAICCCIWLYFVPVPRAGGPKSWQSDRGPVGD